MGDFYKVEGHVNYQKNPRTGEVINTDMNEYINARRRVHKQRVQEARIKSLENEVSELKQLLQKVIDNGNS